MNTTRHLAVGRTERRRSRRYRPPPSLRADLRRAGLLSFLGPNLFRECINLSQGGMRAAVARPLREGERLQATLTGLAGGAPLAATLSVQYCMPLGVRPGLWEAGLRFVDPSPELSAAIRRAAAVPGAALDPTTRRLRGDAWGEAR